MYDKVKELLNILWSQDDMINPDDLAKAQDMVADILLTVAENEGKQDELIKEYGWLYQAAE